NNGDFQSLRYILAGNNTFKPTHVIACWDKGSQTFRTDIYETYKANRGDPPEELIPQFDLVKEAIDIFNIPNVCIENYEADDIIGTLARKYQNETVVKILQG